MMNEKKLTRGEKNKARHKRQVANKPRTAYCDVCGGQMVWCSGCEVYSRTCCEQYGTCMCS